MIPKWVYLSMVEERARTRIAIVSNHQEKGLEKRAESAQAIALVSPGYGDLKYQTAKKPKNYQL